MPLAKSLVRRARLLTLLMSLCVVPLAAKADDGINYETETLPNGLTVIYAPMPTSPVTQVQVFYHVGSKDERSDRQGFAHMFEHMMFRGSEHVKPQEHMKLIGQVGGYSNAYTSFDQTVYVNTVPNNYAQMALWLEADRMSSFKVSAQIFQTERLVVAEEWRMRQNRPYGTMWDDVFANVFSKSHYHWTPIGNMDELRAAAAGELQAFFNKYYVPNNAVLVIAGGIDLDQTKKYVHQYFGWIPEGKPIVRVSPKEPEQTKAREKVIPMRVPLDRIVIAYQMPPKVSDDTDALNLLLTILGEGQSSRLSRALVTSDKPLCVGAETIGEGLEDNGIMGVMATVLGGKNPAEVENILREQIAAVRNAPVTPEEIEKAKQQGRLELAKRWETAESATSILGETMLMYHNLDRVKTARARLEALTAADLQRVAQKYLGDEHATTLLFKPGVPAESETEPGVTSQPATQPVAKETAKAVKFPADYPAEPPMSGKLPAATFAKGVEKQIGDVHVIVMEDHRMPIVNWSLTYRQGGYTEAAGKEGLVDLASGMVRRGPKGKSFDQFNEELESRGIDISVSDGGDNTEVSGSCLKEQLAFGLAATHDMLTEPAFDPSEFAKLQASQLASLRVALNTPATVASRALNHELFGDSPLGRFRTPASIKSITLDDVKKYFDETYRTDDAILLISGDISVADGQAAAEKLLTGLKTGSEAKPEFKFPAPPEKMKIVLIDMPESKQSLIRMGVRSYDLTSDEKFPGSLAGQMLSSGIDSRLGKYVRAEKGYVYGVYGAFGPRRQAGSFLGSTETKPTTTADTIEAMFKVFDDMKAQDVPAQELDDAKFRVAGQLLMSMQTVEQQTSQRLTGILNGYPIDYYDKYAQRIDQVSADQVKAVMDKYVQENHLTVVVVGPAASVKEQLEKLGPVEMQPRPASE
jgi:zinc protease